MGKAALVTGGSRGLGREIVLALGRAGYKVAVVHRKNHVLAKEAAREAGEGSVALRADVADRASVQELVGEVDSRWGRLDLLVNNAGITRDALLPRLSEADWDAVMAVDLTGCLHAIKACTPLLRAAGGGHIVNVSSRSGLRGQAGQSAYGAAKAALVGLTYTAAGELAKDNIRVNALLPGYLPTDMGRGAPEAMESARRESLLGRLSDAKEAASFVAWLAGTSGITGQVFTLDSRP